MIGNNGEKWNQDLFCSDLRSYLDYKHLQYTTKLNVQLEVNSAECSGVVIDMFKNAKLLKQMKLFGTFLYSDWVGNCTKYILSGRRWTGEKLYSTSFPQSNKKSFVEFLLVLWQNTCIMENIALHLISTFSAPYFFSLLF